VRIAASHTEARYQSVCCRTSLWQAECIHFASTAQISLPHATLCCCCRTGNESAIHKALLGLSSLAPEHLRNHNLSQDSQRQPNSSFSSTSTKQATSAHDLQSATLAAILMCPEERSAREEILLKLVSLLESASGQQKLLVAAALYRCNCSFSKQLYIALNCGILPARVHRHHVIASPWCLAGMIECTCICMHLMTSTFLLSLGPLKHV